MWTKTDEPPPVLIAPLLQGREPLAKSRRPSEAQLHIPAQVDPLGQPHAQQSYMPLFVQPFTLPPPYPPPPQSSDAGLAPPTVNDIPGDFPLIGDWLIKISNSPLGDGMPWEACIKPLVEAHYFRVHQIAGLRKEDIFDICKDVIKLPTAELMRGYAVNECNAIRSLKARRS
jgi:hypothetical protein